MFKITRLAVEGIFQNCVTDNPNPYITFSTTSDGQGVTLASATVEINGWKSDITQTGVAYNGNPLLPKTRYVVTLSATDSRGETDTAVTYFTTAKLGEEWVADWITDKTYRFKEKKASPKVMAFRKTFDTEKEIECAVIYSTALGIYEIELNGEKVGKDYFAPGFTQYKKNMQYQAYEVTESLKEDNALTVLVAGGWAVGKFTMCLRNRVFAKRQAIKLELHITYKDGTKELIKTDESWQVTTDGPFVLADFYDGETYDATKPYSQVKWKSASIEKVKLNPELKVTYGTLPTKHEKFEPISVTESESGELIYDFGQNLAGVIEADIDGEFGQTVTFRHAEVLMDGELFTKPLRDAKCTATYVSAGRKESYSPRFTYMGYRYVGVRGIDKDKLVLKSVALYSDMERTGEFSCSNEKLNKLQNNILWSSKSNFVDIPTDCCQRAERLGWTGDIALFCRTASYNFNTSRFYDKWLKDVRVDQKRTGGVPVTVPNVVFPSNYESIFTMAVDHWGDAVILVPWAEYLARGDKSVLSENYGAMKKYLKACKFWAGLFSVGYRRYIWKLGHHYGDWVAPDIGLMAWMSRGKWTATACFANSCGIVSQIATLLGKTDDAKYYANLKTKISRAYKKAFTDGNGKLKKEFQTGYVLPLHYKVFDKDEGVKAANNLAELVKANDYNIATGFPGTPYILFALADNGRTDDAYKMLLNESCPSWLHQVNAGGTTIWERWDALREDGTSNTGADDGTKGMISFNHYANGSVGDFMYRRILGIEALTGGYEKFVVSPTLGGGITNAQGKVVCPYGDIKVKWQITDGIFNIKLNVPVSAECLLKLPDGSEYTLTSGKHEYSCSLINKGETL